MIWLIAFGAVVLFIGLACFCLGYSACFVRKFRRIFPSVVIVDLERGDVQFDKPMPPECSIEIKYVRDPCLTVPDCVRDEVGDNPTQADVMTALLAKIDEWLNERNERG